MVTQNRKEESKKKVQSLRNAEYYNMQVVLDELFSKSGAGESFDSLMDIIISRENILLAYRNIKANNGSVTPGTDGLSIRNVAKCTPEEMARRVRNILKNYRPRAVRRVEIPKAGNPEKTRPLGIPCIWDRLVQQCILQVLEPICEAKFCDSSFGFRPNRSTENAISRAYRYMQNSNLHFVVEVDIKSFFDEVNHSKLIKQMWALGIRDKKLIYIIRQMLTAPINMPDGSVVSPAKGTPQGGILSPLLANIVLNELDSWIEGQWRDNPVTLKYTKPRETGGIHRSNGFQAAKKTKLKEMYIVRYADDFRIFCRTRSAANLTLTAVTQWLETRLRLQVSPEKTRVVNLKRQYSEFLGFKMKVRTKSDRYVVKSHICDKARRKIAHEAKSKLAAVRCPGDTAEEREAISDYNAYVMGIHNYYRIATMAGLDFRRIGYQISYVMKNRLKSRLKRELKAEREHKNAVLQRYGRSKQIRFIHDRPIAPISYVRFKTPLPKKQEIQKYTPEGRAVIHDNLGINTRMMLALMRQPLFDRSNQFADNRIALFCAQYGKCSITGRTFEALEDIHCHHKTPVKLGGDDKYSNLILVSRDVHTFIHAHMAETIMHYLKTLSFTKKQLTKVNKLREMAGNLPVVNNCVA